MMMLLSVNHTFATLTHSFGDHTKTGTNTQKGAQKQKPDSVTVKTNNEDGFYPSCPFVSLTFLHFKHFP